MSAGFGILFATLLIMVVVPALAMQEHRVIQWLGRRRGVGLASAPAPEAFAPAGD